MVYALKKKKKAIGTKNLSQYFLAGGSSILSDPPLNRTKTTNVYYFQISGALPLKYYYKWGVYHTTTLPFPRKFCANPFLVIHQKI